MRQNQIDLAACHISHLLSGWSRRWAALMQAVPRNESVKQTLPADTRDTFPSEDCINSSHFPCSAQSFLSFGRESEIRKMFDVIPCLTCWRSTPDIAVTMPLSSDPEIEIPFLFPPFFPLPCWYCCTLNRKKYAASTDGWVGLNPSA